MADCGSGSVGTCLSSLFIMKHNCLENLSHNVYSKESSNLSNTKCLTLDEKDYFRSSRELVAADDGVLNASKDLHDTSDSAICSLDSPVADSDDFKKKRCMDRYDSSESSDSGVLTGSTCSESSSNSGNSDITDPCSPYSVTFFHLGDDNGSPLALPSKSSSYSNSDLLTDSKMLPENINREEETDVSCWAWDKTIDWNERYELTSEDIDVEVKDSVYFDDIDHKNSEENHVVNEIEIRPNCYQENQEGKVAVNGKLNFAIPLVERKHLLSTVNGFHGKELSARKCCKNGLRPMNKDTSSIENRKNFALPNNVLNINASTPECFYEKVFQQKRAANVYEKSTSDESEIFREEPKQNENESSDITAIKSDDNDVTTNKYFNSYPLDFFNVLPSVFKGPILYSASEDVDDDNGSQLRLEETRTVVLGHETPNDKEHLCTGFTPRHTRSETLFSRTNSFKNISDDAAAYSHNNNNNNNIDKNENNILKKSVVCSQRSPEADLAAKINSLPNVAESVTSSSFREQTRFPREKKSTYFSERICRWADCVDHVPSTARLVEHLQTKHVNPQTFSGTFICLWNGCKVFGRPSCSRTFLERHVLSHGGNKPYRCIVDNCGQRFSSQVMLERHVNQHFKTPKEMSDGFVDTTPKLIRRNGQKLRYRRQPYSVRNRADAFDASVMTRLHYSIYKMSQKSSAVSLNVMDSKQFLDITFRPNIIGSRIEKDGCAKYLVRWYPYNALEDEWLSQSEAEANKTIPIWQLPASVQEMFWNSMFPKQTPAVRQPRKYKKPESSMI